jgi:hypothetical protein
MASNFDPTVFLTMFDDAWSHSWESLASALEGVTEEEAAHVPAMYMGETPEAGWPAPGSILWQMAHLRHCKAYYTALIEQRGETPGQPDAKDFEGVDGLHAGLEALREVHARQRGVLVGLGPIDMGLKVGNGMLLPEFLSMIIRHDIWHASQVALARRAWRTESRSTES